MTFVSHAWTGFMSPRMNSQVRPCHVIQIAVRTDLGLCPGDDRNDTHGLCFHSLEINGYPLILENRMAKNKLPIKAAGAFDRKNERPLY